MRKTAKFLLLTAALAATTVCAAAFTACGDDNGDGYDEENDYMVTVTYSDGTPVKGSDSKYYEEDTGEGKVTAQWCLYDASKGDYSNCLQQVSLDENGKAKYENKSDLEGQTFHIQINYLPDGYTYDDPGNLTSAGNVTIVVYNG